MPPPPRKPRNHPNNGSPKGSENSSGQGDKKQGLKTGYLVAIIVGSVLAASCVLLLLVFCICKARKRKDDSSSEYKDFVGPLSVNIEEGTTLPYAGMFSCTRELYLHNLIVLFFNQLTYCP